MPKFSKRTKKEQVVVERPVYLIELSEEEVDELYVLYKTDWGCKKWDKRVSDMVSDFMREVKKNERN